MKAANIRETSWLAPPVLVLLALSTLVFSACDNWPLYLNLPAEDLGVEEPQILNLGEQSGSFAGDAQSVGPLSASSLVTVDGGSDSCGYDESATWPVWPSQGGAGEESWARTGWYGGDVDIYEVVASFDALVSVALSWENAPDSGTNAPYRPDDSAGGWTQESDLDFVLFSMAGQGLGEVLSEVGVSAEHPELAENIMHLEAGTSLGVVVGCHHALPTNYRLELSLLAP